MNPYRKLTLVSIVITVLVWLTPQARAQLLEQKVHVTFSGPVEVPGEVLPAGSYVFEALESGHLTRILSADEKHVYATLFTVPEERSETAQKATIVLEENQPGMPQKVEAWFYPGYSTGNEFMYKSVSNRPH
jgi:hypothetical protein